MPNPKTALILGASRGLGLGLVREYLAQGWRVIATARGENTALHQLARETGERLRVLPLEITDPSASAVLREHLADQRLDVLFANAGVAQGAEDRFTATAPEAFAKVMLTNVYGPIRAIEALAPLVASDGVIVAMSSGLGSIAGNTTGGWEVYRASKAALNMALASFAAAHPGRAVVAMTPGWVKTDMGGAQAPLTMDQSIPGVVKTLASRAGQPGLAFLGHDGKSWAW